MKPTFEQVSELLNYDPDTGIFTWKVNRKCKAMAGAVAGHIDKRKNKSDYIRISIFNRNYAAHRLAVLLMTGDWPKGIVDHDNRDGTDNRWLNLNVTDYTGNNRNRGKSRRNTSGYTGVTKIKKSQTYVAIIGVNGTNKYLGSFKTIEEAVKARKEAEKKYNYHKNHGE